MCERRSLRRGNVKPLNVGLIGFGTVGRGTFDVLRRNEGEIVRRAGRPIRITWIGTRTLDRARGPESRKWTTEADGDHLRPVRRRMIDRLAKAAHRKQHDRLGGADRD